MPIKELRAEYGKSKKPKLAINAAIRKEIPGGAKILTLTYKLSCELPKLPPKQRETINEILNELLAATEEMKDHIAKKYGLKTAEVSQEKRKAERPAKPKEERRDQQITVRLSPQELEHLTAAGHRKVTGEMIRELVLRNAEKAS